MRLLCQPPVYEWVRRFVLNLAEQADRLGGDEIKRLLKEAVPEYRLPCDSVNGHAHPQMATFEESEAGDHRNGRHPGPGVEIQDTVHCVAEAVAAQ